MKSWFTKISLLTLLGPVAGAFLFALFAGIAWGIFSLGHSGIFYGFFFMLAYVVFLFSPFLVGAAGIGGIALDILAIKRKERKLPLFLMMPLSLFYTLAGVQLAIFVIRHLILSQSI